MSMTGHKGWQIESRSFQPDIEDGDYRPLGCAPADQGVGGHGAVRAMIVNAVLYLISLSYSLILKFG
jgi:hypothetical protein